MKEQLYNLEDLMKLNPKERESKINQSNITKAEFCNKLMTDKKFNKIPGKGIIIKKIGTMTEENFKIFILSLLNNTK